VPKVHTAFNEKLIVAENYAGGEIHAWEQCCAPDRSVSRVFQRRRCIFLRAWQLIGGDQFEQLEPNWKLAVGKETLEMEGGLKILLSLIVASIVLAVVYTCALTFRKRKEALRRKLTAPDIKEQSICRREEKLMTTLPKRFAH
jgi:hypothetical protein